MTILGGIAVLLLVASLFLGSRMLAPADVIAGLSGTAPAEIRDLVWDLRIPRTLLAFFAGAALAVAGLLTQSWTGNPLADPGIIGITAGASFFVALGAVSGFAITAGSRTFSALIGSALAVLLVVFLAHRSLNPLALVLAGVGVSASLQSAAVVIGLFSTEVLESMRRWTVGSTFGRSYEDVAIAGCGLLIGLVLAALAARPLDLLAMGEETSTALGGSPLRARLLATTGIVILAGCATAAAGPIAFVGFAVPHFLRAWLGPRVVVLVAPAALLGGVAVLIADIVGRLIMRPGELEMAIVVSMIGAPLLIIAVKRGLGWKKDTI
nr:iron ABC transporter permease [Corynebacterium yudongzhengii]